jgi:hypothetical protein
MEILKKKLFPVNCIETKFDADFLLLNPLNAELNPICHLLALLGSHHFLHVSRIRVKIRRISCKKIAGN